MFRMEQSSRPPSLKLPLMDDIAKLLQNQDTIVKPGTSSSSSLDIGQFVPNPPNRGNCTTPQMQFMLDISRSTAVAYQHLLEKFLHLLTNLVLIRRDAYLKNAYNSLDAYRLKNLRAAPVSGPDLFERSLMQEYEQHLIGLGVKTGNQQSTRFHPYGKGKKKPRGRGKGAFQQGGYYQVPPPQ